MINSIRRDLSRRTLYKKYEKSRLIYKSLINDSSINPQDKLTYISKLNQLPRNSSKVRIKNRCTLTGRSHGIHKFYRISRIKIRDLANKGLLVGYTKGSW
ncbi:30S ribosomal protein S14 [Paenibacillus sp. MAHUQ-46]|uniref:Small ribosomal subunit protein uS14 n=1 Tax=Paenibacillus roseus TaxID=2798579 RepID=A0A934MNN2_9BACL|nr:30S ribosomal protein S14 [Paenibacillus roseus]MBJ6361196.1 30S ribosomal protein S14 [Paenibacillus roseus]